ncbi:MAG: nucleosidase [Gammaproteobacteria bacterium]
MSFSGGAVPAAVPHTVIIAALGNERAALARVAHAALGWSLVQSGPGPERAAQCAKAAVAAGAKALVSWGLAGGLAADIEPGTVILPRRVIMQRGATFAVAVAWHERLAALATEFAMTFGDLLTVPTALGSPAAKAAAAMALAAVAVDMESAAIAAVAARARVPFVALRVVVDAQGDALPTGAENWIDARGNMRSAAALGAIVRPGEWQALWRLAQRYRRANAVLVALARSVASRRLLGDAPGNG